MLKFSQCKIRFPKNNNFFLFFLKCDVCNFIRELLKDNRLIQYDLDYIDAHPILNIQKKINEKENSINSYKLK